MGDIHIREDQRQFAFRSSDNPRYIYMSRSGIGKNRPHEITVFEIIERGKRIRKLHSVAIRENCLIPFGIKVMGQGRFLVTIDEAHGSGVTDNCVVIYDLVRGKVNNFRLEDFLSRDARAMLQRHAFIPGFNWHGNGGIDKENLIIYPSRPDECRRDKLPFVKIDVSSATVEVLEVPESLPSNVLSQPPHVEGLYWDWSIGHEPEPPWESKFAYPKMIKGKFAKVTPEIFKNYLDTEVDSYYNYDAVTGDYVRGTEHGWTERKINSDKVPIEPSSGSASPPINDNSQNHSDPKSDKQPDNSHTEKP